MPFYELMENLMKTIRVNLSANSYNIYIDKGLLKKTGDILVKEKSPCKTLLITDKNIEKVYGSLISESLRKNKFDVRLVSLQPGKSRKPSKLHVSSTMHALIISWTGILLLLPLAVE